MAVTTRTHLYPAGITDEVVSVDVAFVLTIHPALLAPYTVTLTYMVLNLIHFHVISSFFVYSLPAIVLESFPVPCVHLSERIGFFMHALNYIHISNLLQNNA